MNRMVCLRHIVSPHTTTFFCPQNRNPPLSLLLHDSSSGNFLLLRAANKRRQACVSHQHENGKKWEKKGQKLADKTPNLKQNVLVHHWVVLSQHELRCDARVLPRRVEEARPGHAHHLDHDGALLPAHDRQELLLDFRKNPIFPHARSFHTLSLGRKRRRGSERKDNHTPEKQREERRLWL
jgi:hypothetical protein